MDNEYYNFEIEKAVLYFVIFEKKKCKLKSEYFHSDKNKQIVDIINMLQSKNEEVGLLTIQLYSNEPKNMLEYISDLGNNIYGLTFETTYNSLKELYKRREIYKLLNKTKQQMPYKTWATDKIINHIIIELNKIKGE